MFGNTEAQGRPKQNSMAVENKESASDILEGQSNTAEKELRTC